jgi:hypothetical protein
MSTKRTSLRLPLEKETLMTWIRENSVALETSELHMPGTKNRVITKADSSADKDLSANITRGLSYFVDELKVDGIRYRVYLKKEKGS